MQSLDIVVLAPMAHHTSCHCLILTYWLQTGHSQLQVGSGYAMWLFNSMEIGVFAPCFCTQLNNQISDCMRLEINSFKITIFEDVLLHHNGYSI